MRKIYNYMLVALLVVGQSMYAQENVDIIPEDAFVTAAYATGGTSIHKDKVLWLTWGAQSADDVYGKSNVTIVNGAASYAKIDLGQGKYLKIAAVIHGLKYSSEGKWIEVPANGGYLNSYTPGNYSGDALDDMFNIGGVSTANKLVSGLANSKDKGLILFKVKAKATIEDKPVKLAGMVLGDAESLSKEEYFYAEGKGNWTLVDLKKNLGESEYTVSKTKDDTVGKTRLTFEKGNNKETAAVAFMTFNDDAYDGNSYEVEFEVSLKGQGKTAISLGIIPPGIDMGDAPESFGTAMHRLEAYQAESDGIPEDGTIVNLNTENYIVGSLVSGENSFLGSTAGDSDTHTMYSKDALGDDETGTGGENEEDAWPEEFRRFSHKLYYKRGDKISVNIPYKALKDGFISGWIDFNQNGLFDEEERVSVKAPKADKGSVQMSWTVPADRIVRSTYVRLRFGHDEEQLKLPTGFTDGGEVEDHRIYILGPARTNPMLPSKSR